MFFCMRETVRWTVEQKNASRGRRDERAPEDSPVDCRRARSANKSVRRTVCEADRSESFLQQTRYGCAWQKVDVTKSVRWTVSARQAVSAMPTTDGATDVRYGRMLQQTCHRLLCPFPIFPASLTRKASNREKPLQIGTKCLLRRRGKTGFFLCNFATHVAKCPFCNAGSGANVAKQYERMTRCCE